jgi:Co/Zn/Cd efflux system component
MDRRDRYRLAVAFVTVLHLEGLRRLVARRGRASNTRRNSEATTASQDDNAVQHQHGQAQDDQAEDRAHPEHGHGHRHAHQERSGLPGALAGMFRPHTHDAGDRIDSALAASAAGMRALKISLAALGATAVIQFLVVLASRSVALLAETIHNVADALTAIPIGIAFIAGRRLANRRYTYGYGRAEDVAGLFVLLTMTASALLAAYEAVDRLVKPA